MDVNEAGYTIRREYAEALATGLVELVVTIHPKLVNCKWGAEASLKLEKMIRG